jgi:hypothetical protein
VTSLLVEITLAIVKLFRTPSFLIDKWNLESKTPNLCVAYTDVGERCEPPGAEALKPFAIASCYVLALP